MRPTNQGFVLVYVIVILSLISVYLASLGHSNRLMLQSTNRCQIQAIERNLEYSAKAWIQQWGNQPMDPKPTAITLDTTQLSSRPCQLVLTQQGSHQWQLTTSTTWADQTCKGNQTITFRVLR